MIIVFLLTVTLVRSQELNCVVLINDQEIGVSNKQVFTTMKESIFEVMNITEPVRRMILSNASTDDLRAQAYKDGMVSLWRDGMLKVKQGVTTPYEVQRNVYSLG